MVVHRVHRRLQIEELEPRIAPASLTGTDTPANSAERDAALQMFNAAPLAFVENQGQIPDPNVRYVFQGSSANILFADSGPIFQVFQPGANASIQAAVFSTDFVGGQSVSPVGLDPLQGRVNYLVGNDAAAWKTDLDTFSTVAYQGLYQGVDLYASGSRSSLKYEFHVAPGADTHQIAIRYEGIQGLSVDASGALHVQTSLGELVDAAPYIYQDIGGQRVPVAGTYRLLDQSSYGFEITGAYDTTKPLVIDPDLQWSTFLGGASDDVGLAIAQGPNGNVFVTGYTASSNFPTTPGAYDQSYNLQWDAFITKLDGTSGMPIYSTFLGGSWNDQGQGIAVDASGSAYVTGWTMSLFDFPTTVGAYDRTFNGASDVFVAKLSTAGDALLYSTFIGGNSFEQGASIAVDSSGNAYVTGNTESANFPTTTGAYDQSYNGGGDVFVVKLNPAGSTLGYSTFVGGTGKDAGYGIAIDGTGGAYVAGYTESANFPAPAGYDTSYNGAGDAFILKLNPSGSTLGYSTFLGGASKDTAYGVAVDGTGGAFVTGETLSSAFPTSVGAYSRTLQGASDAFVTKLMPNGLTLGYSTFLGGTGGDIGRGIYVDAVGGAYVAGETTSTNFPTTLGAYDTTYNGGYNDAFVTKVGPDGGILHYSTFLGGTSRDSAAGIVVDPLGRTFVTGSTLSTDFPTTPGAYDTSPNGQTDAFVSMLQLPTIIFGITLESGSDSGLSNSDRITNVTTPIYDVSITFPGTVNVDWDGNGSTDFSHVYPLPGIYQISPAPPFTQGVYPVNATLIYATGTAGDSEQTTIITTPPAPPSVPQLDPASDSGVSSTDGITNVKTPTLNLFGFGSYYRFFRNSVQISGNYATTARYTEGTTLGDGAYGYQLYAVDVAGNVSTSGSPVLSVTIDTVAPAAPNRPVLDPASDTGVSNSDNITRDTNPIINLSGFGSYYRLFRDGGLISTLYGTTSSVMDGPLSEASHQYLMNAVDAAGNVSPPSPALTITIDVTPPGVSSTTPANNAIVNTLPQYDVAFSEAIDTAGVATGDLLLGGSGLGTLVVNSTSILGPSSARFNISGTPGTGIVTLTLPAAAVTDIAGNSSSADVRSVRTFPNALVVTGSTPGAGVYLNALSLYEVRFSAVLDPLTLQPADLVISGAGSGGLAVVSANTTGDGSMAIFGLTGGVGNGPLVLTLPDNAVADPSGNPLLADVRNFTADTIAPRVSSTAPTDGTRLNTFPTYTVNFSEIIDTSGVGIGDLVISGAGSGGLSVGSFTILSGNSVRFNLSGTPGNGAITMTIPAAAVTDLAGNPVVQDIRNFTSDTAEPFVTSTIPADGALLNALTQYTVDFSEAINAASVAVGDLLLAGAGVNTLTVGSITIVDSDTVRFNLSGTPGNGGISFTLPAGCITDLAGNGLVRDVRNVTLDTIAPFVSSTNPATGAFVNALPQYVVNFSEPIDTAGVGVGDLVLSGAGAGTLAVSSFNILDSQTVRFNLTGTPDNAAFTVTIPAGAVSDPAGNALVEYVANYTADTIVPYVVSTVPVQNTILSTFPEYDVTFSENINSLTIDFSKVQFTGPGAGTLDVVHIANVSLNVVRFMLTGSLANGALTAGLAVGAVKDFAGNNSLVDSRNFTGDITAPRVVSSTPVSGSVVFSLPDYVVDFSKPIDPATVQLGDLQLGGPGVGSLRVIGAGMVDSDTLRFSLVGDIGIGEVDLTLPAGAVQDFAGNGSIADARNVIGPVRIPLVLNTKATFTDGDGSTVSMLLTGKGSDSFFTLTNGGTTRAPIGRIVLNETSQVTGLSITSVNGSVLGTTFDRMDVTKTSSAGSAMGTLKAAGISLTPSGQISMDSGAKTLTLGDIGGGGRVTILGPVTTLTAATIGGGSILNVTGNLGTLTANVINTGANLLVGGGITTLKTLKGGLDATVTAGLGIGSITVNGTTNGASLSGLIVASGTAGIGTISVPKGGFTGTIRAVAGKVGSMTLGNGNLMGTVESLGTAGIGTISVTKGGVDGTVRAAAGGITSLTVGDGNLSGLVETGGKTGIGTVSVPKGQLVGTLRAVNGGILSATFGRGAAGAVIESTGTAGIGTVSVTKGGFQGTILASAGRIRSLTVSAGDLAGVVQSGGSAGIGTISITKGGLNGTVTAGHANSGIRSLIVGGAISAGTVIGAGTGGVGTVSVKGNADLTLKSTGALGSFALTGTPTAQSMLSGIFDVKVVSSLSGANGNLNNLVIRAAGGVTKMSVRSITDSIVSAGDIGSVAVAGGVSGSLLLAGWDIGPTYQFLPSSPAAFTNGTAKGNIGAITINGSLQSTSIAANIKPGAFGVFGTADNTVLSDDLAGAIKALTVKGTIIGSTNLSQFYGVVAHKTIGPVTMDAMAPLVLPYGEGLGNIRITQTIT